MIRAVLDTNTIVSAILVPGRASGQVLDAVRAGHFVLIVSSAIVDEVTRTLNRDRIRQRYRLTAHEVSATRRLLENSAELTELTFTVQGVATHPEDDLILATAVSGQADYLETWDAQLLKLNAYEGVTIVSPRDFLDRLSPHDPAS